MPDSFSWIPAIVSPLILIAILWVNFFRPYRQRQAARKKQQAVDRLSNALSDAIHDLLNRDPPVSSDAELDNWKLDFDTWCNSVNSTLDEHFTQSEKQHFDRLGTIAIKDFGIAYNDRHQHLLSQLDLKFTRLRDIIRDNQQRDS